MSLRAREGSCLLLDFNFLGRKQFFSRGVLSHLLQLSGVPGDLQRAVGREGSGKGTQACPAFRLRSLGRIHPIFRLPRPASGWLSFLPEHPYYLGEALSWESLRPASRGRKDPRDGKHCVSSVPLGCQRASSCMSAQGPQQRNVRGSSNPTLSFLCRASPGPCWEDKPPFVTFLFWMRLGRRLWGDGCLPQGSERWMS